MKISARDGSELRLWLVALLLVTGVACGGKRRQAPPPSTTATPKAAPAPRPAARETPAALLARAGFGAVPEPLPDDARRLDADGLAAHRIGKYGEAAALFERALRAAPTHLRARYNLACALARAGKLEAAAGALAPLLEQDPARFAPPWREEPDLAALRASEPGRGLATRLRALERALAEAARSGVPALLWDGAPDGSGLLRPRLLRAGVYLHAPRRFYPLAPPLRRATAALIDPGRPLVVQVRPTLSDDCFDLCHPFQELELLAGAPPSGGREARWRSSQLEGIGEVALQIAGDRVRFRLGPRRQSPWFQLTAGGREEDHDQTWGVAPTLLVDSRGSQLTSMPEGFRVRRGRLERPGARSIALPASASAPDFTTAVLAPDGKSLLLAASVDHCICRGGARGPVFGYAVVRVDLEARQASLVLEGTGSAAVQLDRSGAVYLQTGAARWQETTLRRWSSIDAVGRDPGETIMRGVHLLPPRIADAHCCGG